MLLLMSSCVTAIFYQLLFCFCYCHSHLYFDFIAFIIQQLPRMNLVQQWSKIPLLRWCDCCIYLVCLPCWCGLNYTFEMSLCASANLLCGTVYTTLTCHFIVLPHWTRCCVSGYWFFHCHVLYHAEYGMAAVLQVGEDKEIPRPPVGFPRCGDYLPPICNDNVQHRIISVYNIG
jgi:hypothetical protein